MKGTLQLTSNHQLLAFVQNDIAPKDINMATDGSRFERDSQRTAANYHNPASAGDRAERAGEDRERERGVQGPGRRVAEAVAEDGHQDPRVR